MKFIPVIRFHHRHPSSGLIDVLRRRRHGAVGDDVQLYAAASTTKCIPTTNHSSSFGNTIMTMNIRRNSFHAFELHRNTAYHNKNRYPLLAPFQQQQQQQQTIRLFSSLFPTNFLENHNSNNDGFDDDDDDEDDVPLTERERKRQRAAMKLEHLDEVRAELKQKKGRGWTDPWDVDPIIDAGTDFNSLPDWTPEYVSRISQERVQIYSVTDTSDNNNNNKETKRTIPTLSELVSIALPLLPPPNPVQHMKAYALYRKRYIQKYINTRVMELAEPKMPSILQLPDWDSKQDAIDILFEQIEFTLRDKEIILSKQPNFGMMVERALETYLQQVQKTLKEKAQLANSGPGGSVDSSAPTTTNTNVHATVTTNAASTPKLTPEQLKKEQMIKDEMAVPIFIDCYNPDIDKEDVAVPHILRPMKCSIPTKPMIGRMVEEWELSAYKTTKRIMLRQSTRTIAQLIVNAITTFDSSSSSSSCSSSNGSTNVQLLSQSSSSSTSSTPEATLVTETEIATTTTTTVETNIEEKVLDESSFPETGANSNDDHKDDSVSVSTAPITSSVALKTTIPQYNSTRILVHGMQGVGKTAAIASIVACARQSGSIVLFLPNGNELSHLGYYIEPNEKRPGMYDLPIWSQNTCRNFLEVHEKDLHSFEADAATLETYFTEAQLGKWKGYEKGTSMNLVTLLNHGVERVELAAMCYSAAINVLMKQDNKVFLMVLDEGNCFYMPGQYFHETYDMNVKEAIPYHKISLFEPILNAMNLTALQPNHDDYSPTIVRKEDDVTEPFMMKRGAVIMGLTESHAVSRHVTDALIANAKIVASQQIKTTTDDDKQQHDSFVNDVSPPLHLVEIPRLSNIEVQHMLSNYEATGVGSLRLDRGETVMNPNEVSYLHMVSGGIPQHLMNACMI